jgi:hypothetical protein
MTVLKDLQKFVKVHHVLALVGLVLLAIFVAQYSKRKGTSSSGMAPNMTPSLARKDADVADVSGPLNSGAVAPAQPAGQNEVFASVSGMQSGANLKAPTCAQQQIVNPEDLLPKDNNSQWAQLNPRGNGELNNVNLLQAGYLNGINTVGSSLRNANLQLRSEPPNPQVAVSPWMNTTIEPDLMRVPLELGCGRQ